MRVYHYTKAEHILKTLETGHLKVATIRDLNDPFELLLLSFQTRDERHVQRELRDWLHRHVGFISLSTSRYEPVMWSHYADHHRGVVLAFDVARPTIHEVTYSRCRVRHQLTLDTDKPNIREQLGKHFYPMMTTKSAAWRYEREWRKFVFATDWTMKPIPGRGDAPFFDFRKDMQVTEVILGPDCTLEREKVVEALVQGGIPAPVTKARRAFNTFTVVPDKSA